MKPLSEFIRFEKILKGLSESCKCYALALEKVFVKLKNSGFNFLAKKAKRKGVAIFGEKPNLYKSACLILYLLPLYYFKSFTCALNSYILDYCIVRI